MAEKSPIEAPAHVLEYLRSQNTLTLATATASGLPHAATMVYVADGITLYFCTRPETTTARNIAENPAVAFTIDEYSPDWSKTKGIQGNGECQVLLNAGRHQARGGLFRQRFSFLSEASHRQRLRLSDRRRRAPLHRQRTGAGRPAPEPRHGVQPQPGVQRLQGAFRGTRSRRWPAKLETVQVEGGDHDRAPGSARGQVLHHRGRRGGRTARGVPGEGPPRRWPP